MSKFRDAVTVSLLRMPLPEQPLIPILERSFAVDGSRAQAQVAEQYEKVQALSLGRGKDLVLDLALAGANRLRPRRVKKQFVVRPRNPAELLVKDRETMAGYPNHRASEARRTRITARNLRNRAARRQAVVMYDFFHCIPF